MGAGKAVTFAAETASKSHMANARLHSVSAPSNAAEGSRLGTVLRITSAVLVVGLPFLLLAYRFKTLLGGGTPIVPAEADGTVSRAASGWVPEMPAARRQTTAYPVPPGSAEPVLAANSAPWKPEIDVPHHQTTAYPVPPPQYEADATSQPGRRKS